MSAGVNTKSIAVGLGIVATLAGGAWLFLWLWNVVGNIDRKPPRGGLKVGMMHRKSVAMQDILDGIIRNDWARVDSAAERMATYGDTIQWYLSVPEYQANGESFREATSDLRRFVQQRESESAKEATLRLERSCLECHLQLNQQQQQRQ
jgi:hypothetical protein